MTATNTPTKPGSLRTPNQLRSLALIGYGLSVGLALLVAWGAHVLLGGEGRGGFRDLNLVGLLELVVFVLSLTLSLLLARRVLRVPVTSLLSAGLMVPRSAAQVAVVLEVLEQPFGLELSNSLALLRDRGQVVGVRDARGALTAWERVPRVASDVAVTELRALLARHDLVVVADDGLVRGVITQEMYLAGL